MRVIAISTLKKFWQRYTDAEQPLKSWYHIVKTLNWRSPIDIKSAFGNNVDFLAENRVIFDIKGNKYRLIVKVNYAAKIIFIRFIGIHAEYDKIDAKNI